jgi:hypothetical protein
MDNTQTRIGTKRYFVGNTQIPKPVNHGWSPNIYETLLSQAGFTTKEYNGNDWVEIPNS